MSFRKCPVVFGLAMLGFCSVVGETSAQAVPDTDIFLVDLSLKGKSLKVGQPRNITQRPGYDNQPSFTPKGKSVLFTAQHPGRQTDIFEFQLSSRKTSQLTNTPEAEYSALVTPDGKHFTVIRGKEQHLWQFPLQPTAGAGKSLLEMKQLIGYHVWSTPEEFFVAAFPQQPPMALYSVNALSKAAIKVEETVGRSLHKIPGQRAISYLVPVSDSVAHIQKWNLKTGEKTTVIQALPGSQDFAWSPSGHVLMARGSKLYIYKPGTDPRWKEIADFGAQGIRNITRLAVSPKGNVLAFVAEK